MPTYHDFRPTRLFRHMAAVSPDGATVAYADDASGQFNLVLQKLAGGGRRQVTRYTEASVRRAAWHPDGGSLVYLADTNGNENAQLFRVGVDGGEPEQLSDAPAAAHLLAVGDPFSPDGRWLAYAANDRIATDQDVLIRDLVSGEVRRLYADGGRVYAGHWSPDGTRLTVARWVEGNSDHVVYVVPRDGGPATRLSPDDGTKATYWLGPWLPDGSGFLVRSNAGGEYTGLAVMDAATGSLEWLDRPDWDVDEVTLSPDGRHLAWLVNVDGATELRARHLVTGRTLPAPALPTGAACSLTLCAGAGSAVMLLSTPTRPWNVVAVDLATACLTWVTDAVPAGADPSQLTEPTLVRFATFDGREIPGYLYRTAGPAAPVGVVLSVHGGPVFQERPVYRYEGFYQYLLHRGVAVFAPNVRGSDGYGKAYAQAVYQDWGGGDLKDLDAAVGYLCSLDWVDPSRIGLWGASYGGFAVLSCLSRLPERNWAAAVVDRGPSNLVTLARASPPTWRSLVAAVIGDPETDAEFLLSRSPVSYADQIRAPLLIVQGANDPRVPRSESDQIVARLRARGVDVRYTIYPDEGHGFSKAENQVAATSEAAEFLLAHLAPAG